MEKVIVAFEGEKTARKFAEILEGNVASCIVCHTPDEVKRVVAKRDLSVVVCGYKLRSQTAVELMENLPSTTIMLVIATQNQLDLCDSEDIFRLPAPVSRGDLLASVRMALQMSHRLERMARPQRNEEEKQIIEQAKALLMDRHDMTEDQAHRFIQKRSMDNGTKMVQTARLILDDWN
ncbi:MAG: ANTAR domain-containing protein [Oscillospiraceae bacterium]|nr:ANTAR domain-containing protein [Oscillospiraceae bacterium]